jgi:hypothetical protein
MREKQSHLAGERASVARPGARQRPKFESKVLLQIANLRPPRMDTRRRHRLCFPQVGLIDNFGYAPNLVA